MLWYFWAVYAFGSWGPHKWKEEGRIYDEMVKFEFACDCRRGIYESLACIILGETEDESFSVLEENTIGDRREEGREGRRGRDKKPAGAVS